MKIQGCNAIVFGGARGIGYAYVDSLLERGAKVCLTDVLVKEGEQAARDLADKYSSDVIFFHKCDVTDDANVAESFNVARFRLGPIHIVVYSAGIMQEFEWQKCLDINLGGLIRVVNEARKRMGKDQGGDGGALVATSSIAGMAPQAFCPVYVASKYAINGYIRSWAMEQNYAAHGIRMNCICPTAVNTKLFEQLHPGRVYHAEQVAASVNDAIGQLMFTPAEIAVALIKLLEDDTMNGQLMRVTRECGYDLEQFQHAPLQ